MYIAGSWTNERGDPEYCERCGSPLHNVVTVVDDNGELHFYGWRCAQIVVGEHNREQREREQARQESERDMLMARAKIAYQRIGQPQRTREQELMLELLQAYGDGKMTRVEEIKAELDKMGWKP